MWKYPLAAAAGWVSHDGGNRWLNLFWCKSHSVFQYLLLVPSIITFGASSLGAFVTNLVRNGGIILIWIMKSCAEPYKWKCSVAETCAVMAGSPCADKGLHSLFLFSREENTVITRAISEETRPHLLHCQHAMDFSKCPIFFVCATHVFNHLFSLFLRQYIIWNQGWIWSFLFCGL